MEKSIIGRWGYTIGGIVLLIAALAPSAADRGMNVALFVIAIAFLGVGAAIARKSRDKAPK